MWRLLYSTIPYPSVPMAETSISRSAVQVLQFSLITPLSFVISCGGSLFTPVNLSV